ncbi:CHAT domain-containing protein [Boletus edulis]|nr:CHAT domain-containing protein [Boletus edulis]
MSRDRLELERLNSQVPQVAAHMPVADPDEVEMARQRLASLNPADEAYFLAFNIFANKLMARFALSKNPNDLDMTISETQQILNLAPAGHFFHAPALCIIGQAFTMRFKFRGDTSDLTQAVSYVEAAVAALTPEQSLYLPFVVNLASSLLNRYWMYGDVADLSRIIETSTTALSASLSTQSPYRDSLLNNLATALKERFAQRRDKADLDTALMHYQSCLDLRPPSHPSRHSVLGNLADAMLLKFEVDGHLQDLESAASHYVSALQLRSPGQDGYLLYLTSLGIVYRYLFNAEGNTERLAMAIGCYQTAMMHSRIPNLDHSRLLDNYGAALQSRYTVFGNIDDLDQAIQYLTTSSDILPSTYSGNIADLDSSIEKLSSALQLCAPGYYQRPVILSMYGRALSVRYNAKGDLQDLSLAASMCKDALTLSSPKESTYSSTVATLTSTLLDCFQKSGNIEECQTIIDHCDRALASMRPGEPTAVSLQINRANAFLQRSRYESEKKDIDTCIAAFREIIPTIPEGHREHVRAHLHVGIALETRFKFTEDPKDIDESIAFLRVAHRNCKRGQSLYAPVCMQLGNALGERFDYRYDDVDALDEAIVHLVEVEEILSSTPRQVDYGPSLVNLGRAFFTRFQAQRNKADLDAAIERASLACTLPTLSERFSSTFALASLLYNRYTQGEDLKDLEQCVKLFNVAEEQMPLKHLSRTTMLHNYARAMYDLGRHRNHLQDFNVAIGLFKEAIKDVPASHSYLPWMHLHLAEALHERANRFDDVDGHHEAIKILLCVIETLPDDSPALHSVCHGAAIIFMTLYELSNRQHPSLMEEGFQCFKKAARYTYGSSFMSVYVALLWVKYAKKLHHSSALLAYQTSLDALDQHLLVTASIKGRHAVLLGKHLVAETSTLATDAMACAIPGGELELAVELSEQGRGLLWSQLSRSRTPLNALRSAGEAGRALASDFERDHSRQRKQRRADTASCLKNCRTSSGASADKKGFNRFCGRPSFESLQCAAIGGPVILVNISDERCDAVIVLQDAPPRLVPLPNTSLEALTTLSAGYYHMLQTTSRVGEEKMREREVLVVLRTLWDTVVSPIVDELASLIPRGSRIWWCPTSKLTTLPLHAAGPYRKGTLNLPNIYVSSYTPTLAALIRARRRPTSSASTSSASTSSQHTPPAFIAIGQAKPASSTGPALQTVSTELALVQSLLPRSSSFSVLDEEASTADAALTALATHGWAHIACHGYPNAERPFDAAFALKDERVTVLDIVRARGIGTGINERETNTSEADASIPGEFAFLSACHTAVGDRNAPDEIIHLAATMQFVGYRSFYASLFASGGNGKDGSAGQDDPWDCTRAARALNKAAKMVDKDLVSVDQRIVFIHIGA